MARTDDARRYLTAHEARFGPKNSPYYWIAANEVAVVWNWAMQALIGAERHLNLSEGDVSVNRVLQKPPVKDTTTVPAGSRDTEPERGHTNVRLPRQR
jgi:hypothetical protein